MPWQISKEGRLERLVVYLYVAKTPIPVGELVFEGRKRRQSFFRYARSWIDRRDHFAISPLDFPVRPKAYPSVPHEAPLPFYDAAPDGWGRGILDRAFPNQVFGMAEYLAAAGQDRTGALGFGPDPQSGPQRWVPDTHLIDLATGAETLADLQAAAEAIDADQATNSQISLLFRNSADAGGARPKGRLKVGGQERIAKFKAWSDIFDDPKMEAVSLSLAKVCGIEVPDHSIEIVAGRSVLLLTRFDRSDDGDRYAYISAATLLGQEPTQYATQYSYMDIAAKARRSGIVPCEVELFRRMLYNCFINNTDDHLRNFAFIRRNEEWLLSPAFDLVPHRERRLMLRPAPGFDPVPDPVAALDSHDGFRLSLSEARKIYEEIVEGMRELPAILKRFAVTKKDIEVVRDLMPLAFSPPRLN